MIKTNVISFEDFCKSLRERFTTSPDTVLTDEDYQKAKVAYERAIKLLESYTPQDSPSVNVEVTFSEFYGDGYQLVAHGAVTDLNKQLQNQWNWHLQNTSQWLFAFGLVFDKNRREFSLHT